MENGLFTLGAAYGLGCFSTGYFLVRLRLGEDIRQAGSGSTGASNVGRVLGKAGFAITFAGDLLKGILAIGVANYKTGSLPLTGLAMVAVVAGHIFPLPLRGRGGKGIATAVGAVGAYDYRLALWLLGLFALLYLFTKQWLWCGMLVILLAPFVAYLMRLPKSFLLALAGVAVLIIFAHRDNIRQHTAAYSRGE